MAKVGRRTGDGIKHEMPAGYKPKAVGRPLSVELSKYTSPWPEDRLKQCNGCGEIKQCRDYHRNQHSSDGYQSRCKICQILFVQRTRDKKRAQTYMKQYMAEHKRERSLCARYVYPEMSKQINARRRRLRAQRREAHANAIG